MARPARGRPALSNLAAPASSIADQLRIPEPALVLLLGVLALAVRLPNYQLLPPFTDETEEIYRSLLVAQGKLLPLTNATPVIGSLWNYLVAAAFRLSGFSLDAPRTLILAIGVLTVPATYVLGRAWGGRSGGLLAGLLLTTSAEHVVVSSHVAWSNCATPLFTTLAAWFLYRSVGQGRRDGEMERWRCRVAGPRLALAGLFWGLAVQTHPSALALLPGAAAFLVWKGRPLLRTRWPYLAAGLVLLANLNLLMYNLATGFDTVSYGAAKAVGYTHQDDILTPAYFERFGRLLIGLLRHLGGGVDGSLSIDDDALEADLGLWPIALLAGYGVFRQWRRGNPLAGLLLASAILLMPIFNASFEPILNGRYLVPLLPILYATVGVLVPEMLERLHPSNRPQPLRPPTLPRPGEIVVGLVLAFVVLHPLFYLWRYYRDDERGGNAPVLEAIQQIRANRHADDVVLVDRSLQDRRVWLGDGRLANIFRLAFDAENVPYRLVDLSSFENLLQPANRCRDQFVILASRPSGRDDEIVAALDLRALDHGPPGPRLTTKWYGLYRLERLPDAPFNPTISDKGAAEADALGEVGSPVGPAEPAARSCAV